MLVDLQQAGDHFSAFTTLDAPLRTFHILPYFILTATLFDRIFIHTLQRKKWRGGQYVVLGHTASGRWTTPGI